MSALILINTYKVHGHRGQELSGASSLQNGPPVAGTDGQVHAHITCHSCHKYGHYVSCCPDRITDKDAGGGAVSGRYYSCA